MRLSVLAIEMFATYVTVDEIFTYELPKCIRFELCTLIMKVEHDDDFAENMHTNFVDMHMGEKLALLGPAVCSR